MKQLSRLVVLALLAVLTACTGAGDDQASDHHIVVTTNILGDVVQNIVGDTAEVHVLMKPNADPHSFGVSAQQAAAMTTADLIVYNGLGLEESLLRHVDSAAEGGVPTLAVSEHVDPIRYSSGDNEGQPDPHFWTDPERMLAGVDAVVDVIREHVPGIDTGRIERNATDYRAELRRLADSMTARFGEIPTERRKLVTNHHVLGYLAERFGFTVVGAVVPSGTTLASPSPSDLESLAGTIQAAGVPAIFVDSSHPDRLARVLADEAGVNVDVVSLYSESLDEPGTPGATYLDMMRTNTDLIVTGLTSR